MKKSLELTFRRFLLSKKYIRYGIMTVVILIMFFTLLECKGYPIKVTLNSFNEFQKLMAQIIGTFTAILIGFYFVIFQMLDSKRHIYFGSFRQELQQLKIHLHKIPSHLSYIYFPISTSINFLDNILLRDGIPARGEEEWSTIYKPIEVLSKNGEDYSGFSKKKNIFVDELYSIYSRIEEYLGLLGVLGISTLSLGLMFKSIIRLLFNVLFYIFTFIFISILNDTNVSISPTFLLILIIIGLYLSTIYICQMILHIYDFYRNYMVDYVDDENRVK